MKNNVSTVFFQDHPALAVVKHPELGIHFYPPKTLRDFAQMEAWSVEGHSNADIFRWMANPFWRSDLTVLNNRGRDILFCAVCDQLISTDFCLECGQTIPGVVPSVNEIEMYFIQRELARQGAQRAREKKAK